MQKGTNLTIVSTTLLAPVVQKVDNTIHRINLNPLDSATGFPNTYPLDSAIHLLNNLWPHWFKHQIFTKSLQSSTYIVY